MEKYRKIDLHTHTVYSDGDLDIEGNVKRAIELGIDAIAITDHDNIDSWEVIDKTNYDIPVIKGVEISSYHKNGVVHILGYYLNDGGDYSELEEFLKETRKERLIRLDKMVKLLGEHGINITVEEIMKEADGVVARPHVATAIMKKYPERGYTMNELFNKYIGNDAPCFVPVNRYESLDAIELLKRNHCLVVFAHPLLVKKFDYKELGSYIDGIESFYNYGFESDEDVLEFALQNDLIVTGGSDYHGPITRDSMGKAFLEGEYINKFLERINRK